MESYKDHSKTYAGLLVIGLVFVVLLVGMMNTHRAPEKYVAPGASYATLGSYGYSQPLFEPDVLRRCASGSYMYSSNPELTSYCKTVPPAVLDRVACQRAYRGRPLHLEYTAPAYACSNTVCGISEPGLIPS